MLDAWGDDRVRQECRDGTSKELQAYLDAGLVLVPQEPNQPLTMRGVAEDICRQHGFTLPQLKGSSRRPVFVNARIEFVHTCYTLLGKSYTDMGRFLGGRDHSSIRHLLVKAGAVPPPPRATLASHCKRGHEFTPDNTYATGTSRKCRICSKEADRRRRALSRGYKRSA